MSCAAELSESGPRDVIVDSCGKARCKCNPCKHPGHRCNGDRCRYAYAPNACEEFVLVACVNRCPRPSGEISFVVKRSGCNEAPLIVPVTNECKSVGLFKASIEPGTLAPGWYQVTPRVIWTGGGRWYGRRSSLRIDDCPDEITADSTCDDCEF